MVDCCYLLIRCILDLSFALSGVTMAAVALKPPPHPTFTNTRNADSIVLCCVCGKPVAYATARKAPRPFITTDSTNAEYVWHAECAKCTADSTCAVTLPASIFDEPHRWRRKDWHDTRQPADQVIAGYPIILNRNGDNPKLICLGHHLVCCPSLPPPPRGCALIRGHDACMCMCR